MLCMKCGSPMFFTGNRYPTMFNKIINNKKVIIIKANLTQKCIRCNYKTDMYK